jgi:hypothetical protein
MTPDLTSWLLAQIAEDRRVALEAALVAGDRGFGDERVDSGKEWVASYDNVCRRRVLEGQTKLVLLEGRPLGLAVARHAARHDPARVLAECDAKERLVEELARMERDEIGWDGIEHEVMRYLALPYADRDGFREEWRP